jgi:peptidyl-prolyl cis-trans isomerase B (cyclophilin B)
MRRITWATLALLTLPTFLQAGEPTRVTLQTNKGTITLALVAEKAPKSVANFLTYVNAGFYDGTIFHRVISGFMAQGGGYSADYKERPTRAPIPNEANNGLKNKRGTVAMARTPDPNSATAQFFINVADNAFLDHTASTASGWGYSVFGQVVAGMDVVDKIEKVPTGAGGPFPQDVPQETIIIEKASVEAAAKIEKSDHAASKPQEPKHESKSADKPRQHSH